MPFEHDIGDSTPQNNPEQDVNWRSVGDLARALVERMAERKARDGKDG